MCSSRKPSRKPPGLNTRTAAVSTSLNVPLASAKEGMVVMFVDILTRMMLTQQVTLFTMQKYAGGLKQQLPRNILMLPVM
jgi:hypothetical protein